MLECFGLSRVLKQVINMDIFFVLFSFDWVGSKLDFNNNNYI